MNTMRCRSCREPLKCNENSAWICVNPYCKIKYTNQVISTCIEFHSEIQRRIEYLPNMGICVKKDLERKLYLGCIACGSPNIVKVEERYVCSDCGNGTLDLLKINAVSRLFK